MSQANDKNESPKDSKSNGDRVKTFIALLCGVGIICVFAESIKVIVVCLLVVVLYLLGSSKLPNNNKQSESNDKPVKKEKTERVINKPKPQEEKPYDETSPPIESKEDMVRVDTAASEKHVTQESSQETVEKEEDKMTSQDWDDFFASLENGGDE